MGERIDDPPIPPGNDCPACTPGRWPVGENPKFVYVQFWGLIDCGWSVFPAPNGQIFKLEQVPGIPCWWQSAGDPWIVDWFARRFAGPQSTIDLADRHGFHFFTAISLQCPPEYWTYVNQQAACIFMYAAARGFATIWWNDTVTGIIESFGLTPGRSLFYELFKNPGMREVHKFCDIYQRTNIKFLT